MSVDHLRELRELLERTRDRVDDGSTRMILRGNLTRAIGMCESLERVERYGRELPPPGAATAALDKILRDHPHDPEVSG